jgi:DNA modification methylase
VIAVRRTGLSDAQKRALALYDNRTAELATWHIEQLLADQQAGLDLAPFWTDEELAALLHGNGAPKAGKTAPDAVPEVRATDIQRGDLFALGAHRLLCGDSTVAADVARVMGSEKADCSVTSPPYPGAKMWETEGPTLIKVGRECLQMMRETLKPGRVLVWNTADVPCGQSGMQANPARDTVDALAMGWTKRAEIVWEKGLSYLPPPWNTRRPTVPNCTHELLLVFFNGEREPREKDGHLGLDALHWNRESVWKISPAKASEEDHLAPFPAELPLRCLQLFSFEKDVVFEPFNGSGTTLIAAEQLGRACRAIEIEPQYVQVTLDRWESFTGQRAQKVGEAIRAPVTRHKVTGGRTHKTQEAAQPPARRGRRAARARQ